MERVRTYCRICEAACGMVAERAGGELRRLVPDAAHPISRGFACVKGPAMVDVHRDPARLDHPERRLPNGGGDRWTRVSWTEALADIGARLKRVRDTYGPDAIGVYIGNPTAFNVGLSVYAAGFLAALGTRNFYNAASLDCQNKFAVAEEMFGHYVIQPIPDLDHTDFFLCLGSNPLVSQMSFVAMPRALERLKGIVARGGRVVSVNPRRTETADAVGEQLFIRPDSDAFLLMAMLRVIFDEELEDGVACAQLAHLDELRAAARAFELDDVAAATGIARDTIVELARSFARAPSANAYCSTGVNQGSQGSLAFLGVQALNAITGNLDRAGGARVPSRAVKFAKLARLLGRMRPPRPSRIGNFAPVAESLPTGILADEILTPGQGQIRALLVIAGNPLLSAPSGARLGEALRALELCVAIDLYRNETGALAHYTLPATDWLEREDFPLVQSGMQPEPYAQLSPAVAAPRGERRQEADILVAIARAAKLRMFGTPGLTSVFGRVAPEKVYPWVSRLVGLPASRQPVLVAPDTPGAFLDDVPTRDGRVDVGPAKVLADVPRALERCRREATSPPGLKLIGRRQRRSHNSWMNDLSKLKKSDDGCRLAIHPTDAARLGVTDGARVSVTSAVGRVEVEAELDEALMPGTVSMPHGWRINVNELAADGPAALEPLSGMARYNGIEVDVQALRH